MSKPLFDPTDPNILIFDKLDSTSSEAKRMIKSGYAEHGLIVWAQEQDSGHGRYGRKWQSRPGNLTFSVVIENQKQFSDLAIYPFIAALAIRDALVEHDAELDVRFKWPNDILLNGKKMGGILFESEIQGDSLDYLICGIGINITNSPTDIKNSTSLYEEEIKNITADQLIFGIVINLDKYLKLSDSKNGAAAIYNLWLDYADKLGEDIIVVSGDEQIKGKFETIEDGNLIIVEKTERRVISTGDVFFSEDEKIITTASNVELTNVTFLNTNRKK